MRYPEKSAWLALLVLSGAAIADDSQPIDFNDVEWQSASVDDMVLLEPYIGTFISETHIAETSGKEYFFTVRYKWFNTAKTVVKWEIDTHFPDAGEVRRNGEGFYAFDPFEDRIMVTGFFPDRPVTSKGWLSSFDRETGERVVRIMAMSPDGEITQIRDTFRIADANSFLNATFISVDGNSWQALPPGTYTRIDAK